VRVHGSCLPRSCAIEDYRTVPHTSDVGSLRGNVEDLERGSQKRLTGFVVSVVRILAFWTRASYATKIPRIACHPYGWPNAWAIIAFWKMAPGHGRSYPHSGQNLATGVPAGAAGTSCRLGAESPFRTTSEPERAGLSALSHRDAGQSKPLRKPDSLRYLVRVNPSGPISREKP